MKQDEVTIRQPDGPSLMGTLTLPESAWGTVVFAHGSGSSRFSPRNRFVAQVFNRAGLATLLLDLLTEEEEAAEHPTRHLRFDVPMLAGRLRAAMEFVERALQLPIGLFGASTGAGAALIAAAEQPDRVSAVVSRGGRPDLAGDALEDVVAPTLLIVGDRDIIVIELNEQAQRRMTGETRLELVTGATHLFEEPGTLEQVAELATSWFERYLGSRNQTAVG